MSIGIGGAGSKLASLLDGGKSTIINVSNTELDKIEASRKVLAVTHSRSGQYQGSGRNPDVGRIAYHSVSEEIENLVEGELVFTSTGGGTGNGICSTLLDNISNSEDIYVNDRTLFAFILPYLQRESSEYVENTIQFLLDPVSNAIDSGNTGNMMLFSNRLKFEARISEENYNFMMINSLKNFLSIPWKGQNYKLLDGHIDYQDFKIFKMKPYFNHFTQFDYDTNIDFGRQLQDNYNPLLLSPERAIEALFLLEVPNADQAPMLYNILDHFANDNVAPSYGVILNEELESPRITVSILYSRKPRELVDDFKAKADNLTRKKLEKTMEQFEHLESKPLDIEAQLNNIKEDKRRARQEEARRRQEEALNAEEGAIVTPPEDDETEEVLDLLRRLKKIK